MVSLQQRLLSFMTLAFLFAGIQQGSADSAIRYSMVDGMDGVPLRVAEAGEVGKPAILFLHGSTQSLASWRYQLESDLAERFHLIAFDLRGHGDSGKPWQAEEYHACKWGGDVAAVLTATGAQDVTIVGWSMGGLILGHYVRCHGTDGIRAAVLAASTGGNIVAGGPPRIDPRQFSEALNAPALSDNLRGARIFADSLYAAPPDADWREEAIAMILRATPHTRAAGRAGLVMFRGEHIGFEPDRELQQKLRIPMLAILGGEDVLSEASATAAAFASDMPWVEVKIYDEVGHSPFAEAPERFNRDLADFIEIALQADAP